MKKTIFFLIFSFFIFPILVHAQEIIKISPVDYTLEPLLSQDWVCYIQDGELFIRSLKTKPIKIRSSKETSGTIISPTIQVNEGVIYVIWIERRQVDNKVLLASLPEKNLSKIEISIILSTNSQSISYFIDSNNKIVYIIETFSDKNTDCYMTVYDMNSVSKATAKKIYLPFKSFDTTYNHAFLSIKDSTYIFFAGVKDSQHFIGYILFNLSEREIKKSERIIDSGIVSFIEPLRIKDKALLIYKTSKEGEFVLEGVVEEENKWGSFSIKQTEGMDVARLDSYSWDDGRLLIVFSGEVKGKFKQRIFSAITEDYGRKWEFIRLDNKEFDNTRSWLPRLAITGDNVAVAWEDSRDIRSGIRMKLSSDRGKTWSKKDILLSDKAKIAFRPRINFIEKFFYISWLEFTDDEKTKGELILRKISLNEATKASLRKERIISSKKKELLLRARVNEYWKAMIKKDIRTVYMIHDPFYRARIPFDYFNAHRRLMIYHNYSIEGIKIEGNIASVKLRVKYEVPKLIIQGKESSIPPKEIVAEDTYLFVDGKWFRKFVDVLSDGSAIDY